MIDFIYIDVDYSDKMIVKFTYKSILAESFTCAEHKINHQFFMYFSLILSHQ